MNIFYLHKDARISAQAMSDKHVVKMIVETAQLLSTAHHVLDGVNVLAKPIYKPTHHNHPSAVWVRETIGNYLWARNHLWALLDEYALRYNKKPSDHATYKVAMGLKYPPMNIKNDFNMTPMRIAITDVRHHVKDDAIASYRKYYVAEKLKNEKDLKRYLTFISAV
jgi:hypothetical protein